MSLFLEYIIPLHPAIVHFPIILLILYAIMEILGVFRKKEVFSQAAVIFLLAGVIGLLAAVLTGNHDAQIALKTLGNIPEMDHETHANITMWFFVVWGVMRGYIWLQTRKKKLSMSAAKYVKYAFVIMAIAGCTLILVTARGGGELVYEKGVGTALMYNHPVDTSK